MLKGKWSRFLIIKFCLTWLSSLFVTSSLSIERTQTNLKVTCISILIHSSYAYFMTNIHVHVGICNKEQRGLNWYLRISIDWNINLLFYKLWIIINISIKLLKKKNRTSLGKKIWWWKCLHFHCSNPSCNGINGIK